MVLIMASLYWPGFRSEVQVVRLLSRMLVGKSPAIPRAPLQPLPLVEAPFDRISNSMDIIGALQRSAQGY